jgi:hypothetical protein
MEFWLIAIFSLIFGTFVICAINFYRQWKFVSYSYLLQNLLLLLLSYFKISSFQLLLFQNEFISSVSFLFKFLHICHFTKLESICNICLSIIFQLNFTYFLMYTFSRYIYCYYIYKYEHSCRTTNRIDWNKR